MKKYILFLCGILITAMANGQIVIDNFQVGPYEVDYLGKGDVNFRLRKGVNLYEYFGLQKDTVIIENRKDKPIKRAFEMGVSYSTPRFGVKGEFNSFGLYGTAKLRIVNSVYFNYGGIIACSYGYFDKEFNYLKDVLFEVGIPLSIEFAKLDRSKSTVFANIGVAPTFYSTVSAKEIVDDEKVDGEKKDGFYIAPKVEIGGFIPINDHLIKIGLFGEYRIGCSKEEDNIFKQRIGRVFVGARLGFVF